MNLDQSVLMKALQQHALTSQNADGKANQSVPDNTDTPRPDGNSESITKLNSKIDEIYQSILNVVETHCTSKEELDRFQKQIEEKVTDLNDQVNSKGNKNSIANALHRKANKSDLLKVEEELVKYSSIGDKLDKMLKDVALVSKANQELISTEIENKRKEIETGIKKGINKELKRVNEEIMKFNQLGASLQSQMKEKATHKDNIQGQLTQFFRNYALELYGTSVLEIEQNDLTLKTIFDRIFENQISQLDLDMRFKSTFDQFSKKVEKSISEQLSEEVEEI